MRECGTPFARLWGASIFQRVEWIAVVNSYDVSGYEVYFDASGHPADTPVLFVSGFISTRRKWQRFEQQWNMLLDQYGIPGGFHMTDFVAGRKPYDRLDNVRRAAFLRDAVKVIKLNTNKSVSSGAVVADLRRAQEAYDFNDKYPPFAWNSLKVLLQVDAWARSNGVNIRDVGFMFEDGDKDKGTFYDLATKLFGVRTVFHPKADYPQFQAADFVAWEHRRLMQAHLVAGDRDVIPRESVLYISRMLPHHGSWMYWDWDFLSKSAETTGLKRVL